MSWFNNISGNLGNLSQIASNVTNFTKEVLQDAATESFNDIHTESEYQQNSLNNLSGHETPEELIRKITYLQNEIQTLHNDITFKDEQIAFLQDENQACGQFENHIDNLKAVLIEKEKEIEVVVQRLDEKDSIHQEQIDRLNETISNLEARLSQQQDIQQQPPQHHEQQQDDSTDSWTDDWSLANNSQDINDLTFKIECLSNDLAMKEVVVNSIEAKMSQISNSEINAANFSEWIDVILHEKQVSEDKFKQISNILEDKMNLENHWNGLCNVIEKYTSVTRTDDNNDNYIYHVDEWFNTKLSDNTINTNKIKDCTNLENEISNYKNIVANIENSISKYSEGYDNFKITEFNEWLDNVGADNFIYYNDDSKSMLERIQDEIRDFDDEDSTFRIENFSIWFEKVQCKIDDLEIELINEQETRDTEEKQRILERETLNELFNQKQKEISLLKVELYHKQSSSSTHSLNPIMEVDQEELSTMHEQLNEVNTRCEALQEELAMVKKQSPDTSELQQQINQLSTQCHLTKEQLDVTEERHQQVVAELNEKYNAVSNTSKDLELQVNNLSAMNDCIKVQLVTSESTKEAMHSELNNYRIKYDSISAEFDHVNGELKQATSRYELLQAAETVSDSLQLQLNDLTSDKDQLKEQLQISESSKDAVFAEFLELKETYVTKCSELDECVEFSRQIEAKMARLKEQHEETIEKQRYQQEQLDVLTYNKEELIRTRDEATLELEEYKFNYKKVCDELNDASSKANESLQSSQMIDTELQDTKTEFNLLKLLQLQTEEEKNKLQSVYDELEKAHDDLSVNYMKICEQHEQLSETNKTLFENNLSGQSAVDNELNCIKTELQSKIEQLQTLQENKLNLQLGYDSDLGLMMNVLRNLMNNCLQPSDWETPLSCRTSTPLFEVIRVLSEKYIDLQNQSIELNETSEKVKTELQDKDLKLGEQTDIHNILVYIVKSLDELLPTDKKTGIIKDGDKLSTTDISKYVSHITNLNEFIRDSIENTKTEYDEKLDEATQSLELERSTNAGLLSQIDRLDICISNDKARIEQLQSQYNTEELETALEMERVANRKYQSDIEGLHTSLNDYKKTVERLKAEVSKSASPSSGAGGAGDKGGMKFGALKKKLLELEAQNESLMREVEQLKNGGAVLNGHESSDKIKQLKAMLNDKQQECECYEQECKMLKTSIREMQQECVQRASTPTSDASMISLQHQEQLHSLSLMLTEKNEEIDSYREETDQLKSKLLEVENETSDLELIREECKQLKAMLVGKEHQNKIDDTITTLQSESKQLKQLLVSKDSEVQYMQNMVVEKENELSNMELIREECKQLKQMLIENGQNSPSLFNESVELEAKNAEIIELRNSTSDMELLREECKQLKQMLLNNSKVETPTDDSTNVSTQLLEAMLEDRDVQIVQQSAVIADLQNKTSNMDLLQEECQHLKTMLASSGKQTISSPSQTINSSGSEFFESSFVLQVQQLEEFVKEKDEELRVKTQEIEFLTAKLLEKENAISDFDLIQNECKMLKEMLKEKEELFIELQNDFDAANDVLQAKNEDFRTKESEYEQRLQESFNYINVKDLEISRLTEEVTDNMAQDENLHILQTEYRNVEENLKTTQNELHEVKQLLEERDLEFIDMKRTLTVSENECERLRLYADQHAQMNITLQEKIDEVSCVKLEVETLRTERDSLLNSSHERESNTNFLEEEIDIMKQELRESSEKATKIQNELNKKEMSLNEANATVKSQLGEIDILMSSIDNYSKEIRDKSNKTAQLESELLRSKEHQDSLLESIKMYSSKEQELSVCKNCEHTEKERQMINGIIDNIRNILMSAHMQTKERSETIIEQLSFIESSIPTLIERIREKDNEITNLINNRSEMKLGFEQSLQEKSIEIDQLKNMIKESTALLHTQKNSYDLKIHESQNELKNSNVQTLNNKLVEINSLKSKLEENTTAFNSQKETYTLKIQDLQSQIIEMSDIQVLYQNKCGEYLQLQDEFHQKQKLYKDSISASQMTANSKTNEELECLRNELERSSHLYLNKNKECDTLKLEVLQLEETVHNLNMSLQQLKGFEETAKTIPTLQLTISNKDEEMNILKSTIEDHEQKLEGSKKQKEILDDLLRSKGQLDKEKEDLLFQNEQKDRLIQEKEVAIRHKDVTIREMESKTKRELERLRGHMIMTEEAHTKDILELQDKEEALQQELEGVRQGLSKKSIILQDSSKQFQEHCIDLEVQLQSISAQRDTGVMELSKCHERMQADASAIYNLQNALEQLEKEKTEQSEYLVSMSKRKEHEHVSRIEELTDELNKTQGAMSEASLAVQGINKLNLELTQKENELKVCKEKMGELVGHLHTLEEERKKIVEAADHKLDKSLLRNLFMKYFQAPNDKRGDILHVIGGLLGWTPQEIALLGSGAAPSKVGGWINSVWSYGSSPKKLPPTPKATTPVYDANKSLSELFVKFLEDETAREAPVDTTSLTLNTDVNPNLQMFVTPTTPDILAFHNNSPTPDGRIPAPGQEIPRVHTHHAQSTLKSILTSGPY